MPIVLFDERDKAELQGQINEINETLKTITTPIEVDPIFANNSWELIKWVCQHDDPSKYWKVGDYKEIAVGEQKQIYEFNPSNVLDSGGAEIERPVYGGEDGQQYVGDEPVTATIYDEELFFSLVGGEPGEYKVLLKLSNGEYGNEPGDRVYSIEGLEGEYRECGISLSNNTEDVFYYYSYNYVMVTITREITGVYPLQIIGFNHDKVTDPYNYGKQKAGLTLQLGCSRSQYGDNKASLFDGVIQGIMASNGKYYKAPNKVLANYGEGATNWADGGFRAALQTLFDGTEVGDYIEEVQKYTSQYFNESNYWCAPLLTADRVFLPSEWEVFGVVVHSPVQEGDQYEFYKDGYSKFMWHKDMLKGDVTKANLWLRSAQGASVNVQLADNASTCAVYLNVKSYNPLSVNYTPSSAASENSAGFIAPCICL